MEKLTRRQRQKKNKKDAIDFERAKQYIKKKYDWQFELYNSYGIKDPVPRQVWFNLINTGRERI